MKTAYSVLMSVYQEERPEYLQASIQSMLDQTIPPKEFILVRDGPLNNALDSVIEIFVANNPDMFKIITLEKNQGLGLALNKGIHCCAYELIARMDSDDISLKNRCAHQLEVFDSSNVDIVGGTVAEFEQTPIQVSCYRNSPQTHEQIMKFARRRNPFNHPCVMYKKSVVLKAGGYQHFPMFEDYFLWVRMLQAGAKGYNIPQPLLYMRADLKMYDRRGGIQYIGHMVNFRWHLFQCGFSRFSDMVVSVIGQAFICMLPARWRKVLYRWVLRQRKFTEK